MTMNQSCYVLVTKLGLGHVPLYFAVFEGVVRLRGETVSAVVNAIIVDTITGDPFFESLKSMIRAFAECMAPRVELIEWHNARNRHIANPCDVLQPRLMPVEGDV